MNDGELNFIPVGISKYT